MLRATIASLIGTLIFWFSVVASPAQDLKTRPLADEPLAIVLQSRVFDGETERPVSNAQVRIHREWIYTAPADFPAWVRDETLRTDDQGRFKIVIPSEHVSKPMLRMSIHLDHPSYTPVETRLFSPYVLNYRRSLGERPVLRPVFLTTRRDYTARVTLPDGQPAVKVPYRITSFDTRETPLSFAQSACVDRTDDQGLIHCWLRPQRDSRIELTPEDFAPLQAKWTSLDANVRLQHSSDDLEFKLPRGQPMRGRAIGLDGQPLSHIWLGAIDSRGTLSRRTKTRENGTFEFGPFSTGVYIIHGASQSPMVLNAGWTLLPPSAVIIESVAVIIDNEEPPAIVVKEAPTTLVNVRQIDPSGRPLQGDMLSLYGTFPPDSVKVFANLPPNVFESTGDEIHLANAINARSWVAILSSDSDGKLNFRAPIGLQESRLSMIDAGLPGLSCRFRAGDREPLKPFLMADLGTLADSPQPFEFEYAPAPMLKLRFTSRTNRVPQGLQVSMKFNWGGLQVSIAMERLEDGLQIVPRLCADTEYILNVHDEKGQLVHESTLNLPAGEIRELTLDADKLAPINTEPGEESVQQADDPRSHQSNP